MRRRQPTLYRLAAQCPRCHTPPLDFIPGAERARYADDAPDRLVRRTKCDHRPCGMMYWITAAAYQNASPLRKAA